MRPLCNESALDVHWPEALTGCSYWSARREHQFETTVSEDLFVDVANPLQRRSGSCASAASFAAFQWSINRHYIVARKLNQEPAVQAVWGELPSER